MRPPPDRRGPSPWKESVIEIIIIRLILGFIALGNFFYYRTIKATPFLFVAMFAAVGRLGISLFVEHSIFSALVDVTLLGLLIYSWFGDNDRDKKMKKALRELGDKSKARVRVLVDQMTPSPLP